MPYLEVNIIFKVVFLDLKPEYRLFLGALGYAWGNSFGHGGGWGYGMGPYGGGYGGYGYINAYIYILVESK